jgi:hypothetical protein
MGARLSSSISFFEVTYNVFILLSVGQTGLPVICGLGNPRLISSIYPEQFKLRSALVDGFKARQKP